MKNVWEAMRAGSKQRISASPSRIDVFSETPALLMSFPFSDAYANVIKYNFSFIVFEKFCSSAALYIAIETMAAELKVREDVRLICDENIF